MSYVHGREGGGEPPSPLYSPSHIISSPIRTDRQDSQDSDANQEEKLSVSQARGPSEVSTDIIPRRPLTVAERLQPTLEAAHREREKCARRGKDSLSL